MNIVQRLLLIVLLAAIPIGLLQAYSVRQEQREQREQVSLAALRTAYRAAAEQRRIVGGARQLLAALSQIPAVRDGDARRCSEILKRLQTQFDMYVGIGVADPQGRVWCSSTRPGTNVADRAYFQQALATRQFTTGGYIVGRVMHRRSLNFSLPFEEPSGKLAGVLIAGLGLEELAADLSRAELPPASRLAIIGPDKRVLVDFPGGAYVGTLMPQRFDVAFDRKRAGIVEGAWLDGSDRLTGFVPPGADQGMPFMIAVGIDRGRALGAVQQRAFHELFVLILTIGCALLLAWWFATRFVRRPMHRLAHTVRAWREGNGRARVGALDAGSEFDDLGQAFDAMAEAVDERQRQLRDALESTTDTVLIVSADWTITFLNERARDRLGEVRALGRMLWHVFPDAAEGTVGDEMRAAMASRQPVTVTFEYKRLAGHFEANAFPVRDGGLALFVRDVTEQHRAQEKLRELALSDALTGLPNRFHAMDIARRTAADHRLSAMLILDLDDFKHVNDSLGHPAGDEMLREVARRLSRILEGKGLVGRLGGDEFVALLFDLDEEESLRVGRTLQEHLERDPMLLRNRMHQITSSCGLVLVDRGAEADVEELLANADLALYRAKGSGGGTCHVFSAADREAYESRRLLEEELAAAVSAGQFELYYQPQLRMEDGTLVGAEALLRWHHPRYGVLGPDAFIDLVAASRHARVIGEWVLAEACREAASWWRLGHRLRIGVNLLAEQLRSGDLAEVVQRTLTAVRLPAQALELEITEDIALEAEEGARATLLALRMLGVHLALDDFGTGFASLTTLKTIPADRLKIDRSFVMQLPHNEHDKAIVEAVLALARTLSLDVIAEGVETAEQEAYLRSSGCQEGQGFHYARPMRASAFRAHLLAPDAAALAG